MFEHNKVKGLPLDAQAFILPIFLSLITGYAGVETRQFV
jgi:hypothetical protein